MGIKKFDIEKFLFDMEEIEIIREMNPEEIKNIKNVNNSMAKFSEQHKPGVKRCTCMCGFHNHGKKIKGYETIRESYIQEDYSPNLPQ